MTAPVAIEFVIEIGMGVEVQDLNGTVMGGDGLQDRVSDGVIAA